jgi:hypothetical protein
LVKPISILLNDFVIAFNLKALAVYGFEIGIWGGLLKAIECIWEMAMVDDKGISGVRVLLITVRK